MKGSLVNPKFLPCIIFIMHISLECSRMTNWTSIWSAKRVHGSWVWCWTKLFQEQGVKIWELTLILWFLPCVILMWRTGELELFISRYLDCKYAHFISCNKILQDSYITFQFWLISATGVAATLSFHKSLISKFLGTLTETLPFISLILIWGIIKLIN